MQIKEGNNYAHDSLDCRDNCRFCVSIVFISAVRSKDEENEVMT